MLAIKSLFFTLLLLSFKICLGQSFVIQGVVRDSVSKLPIQDAIITIKQSDRIIGSSYTNSNGGYLLSINGNNEEPFDIACRHISYVGVFQTKAGKGIPIVCDFLLIPSSKILAPVEIKSKWEVKTYGDTLKYNPEAYKSVTTKTVADLLANIPGFKVLPDGQILFQNKSIAALLIDGDDIANEQYGVINKNLDARAIAGIEVFNNYEKNSVLATVRKSGKLAVNLTVNESFKGKISGNITTGLGVPNRAIINPSLTCIQKKSKHFLFGNANNVALDVKGDVFKVTNRLGNNNSIFAFEQASNKFLKDPQLQNNDLPLAFTINNQTAFASMLGLIKQSHKKEFAYRIGYEYDRQVNEENEISAVYIDSTQNWLTTERTVLEKRRQQLVINLRFVHNNSTKFAGEGAVIVLLHHPNFDMNKIIGGILTDTTQQLGQHQKMYVKAGYNGAIKTKPFGILLLDGFASFQTNRTNNNIVTNRFNNFFQYFFPETARLQQNFNFNEQTVSFSISNLPKSGKKQLEYGFQWLQLQRQYNQYLAFIPIHHTVNPSIMRFLPSTQNAFYGMHTTIKLNESAIHKINLQGKLGLEQLHVLDQKQAIVNYNFQLQHSWKLGKFLNLQSDASLKKALPEMDWFGPDTVLQSFQNLVQPAKTITSNSIFSLKSGLNFRKLIGDNYSLSYSYTKINGEYDWMLTIQPYFNRLQAAPVGFSHEHSVASTMSKFIYALQSTISLNGNFTYHKSNLVLNQLPVTNHIQVLVAEVKWGTSFTKKVNFEASVIANSMKISQYALGNVLRSSVVKYQMAFKSVYQPINKTHIGVDIKALLFENARSWVGQIFIEQKLTKIMSLQLQWHNTFFTKAFTFLYNTPNSRGFSSFQLVPTYLLGKVTWYL